MSNLKNIVRQLSEKDFKAIYDSLIESNAEKSAYLLKSIRERQISDKKVIAELEVNPNAFYTLRSRLNIKIEEYLMEQLESPRTDVLRKVANINEVLFKKKRTILIATLKKLEKELIDYDLANELTIIYKLLKKLHINSTDYFQYSQLYNRHVAYMLAVDKAEDLLADYFKKYGSYFLTEDATEKLGLTLLVKDLHNIANLYKSHRLYVYKSCMLIFHRLFVEPDEDLNDETQLDADSIEDIFHKVQKIFDTYPQDVIYYHINLVFKFLKLEYYNHYNVYRQAEKFYREINNVSTNLLTNYPTYTFPAQFLISKIKRSLRLGMQVDLYAEAEAIFEEYEPDTNDLSKHVIYITYRALACYYIGKYGEAAKLLNALLNEGGLKKYLATLLEVKSLLALQYALLHEYELFSQLANSIQRQVRVFENDECRNIHLFLKILRISISEGKTEKAEKIAAVVPHFNNLKITRFAPTMLIKFDKALLNKLTEF